MKKNELYKIGKDLGIDILKIEKIILKITGIYKSQLFLCEEIDEKYIKNILNLFDRLIKGEPIEYILNHAEFYSLDFYVDNRVLIPRNDTEVMIDEVLNELINPKVDNISLIDVGTGSSCIVISILKNSKNIDNGYVVDISKDALDVSKYNIDKHGLNDKIVQIEGDLLKPLLASPCHGMNSFKLYKNVIITANLPYVKNGDFENMDKKTILYEPSLALYGGKESGFELYEKLINQCFEIKKLYNLENIVLFIEIGYDQKDYCEKYLKNLGKKYEMYKDNFGIYRCVKIYL